MILGILGPAASGKDTMADYLVAKYGFVKVGLADPLKRICREVYAFTDEQLWGPSEKRNAPDIRYPIPTKGHLTPRTALQTLGTEWGRHNYENTWVDYGLRIAQQILEGHSYTAVNGIEMSRIKAALSPKVKGVVFSDLRFKNELKAFKAKGSVIRLKRDGTGGDVAGGVVGHASEQEQLSIPDQDFDYVLRNPEGISNFHTAIDKLFSRMPALTKTVA
jgi:hypothetical protein